MKKTFILSTIILSLMTIFGCGNKTETIEASIIDETVVETTAEEVITTVEDAATGVDEVEEVITTAEASTDKPETLGYVKESKSDDSTEETEEITDDEQSMDDPLADGVFTEEEAMYKVERLIMAYEELIKSNKNVEWNILDRCEKYKPLGYIEPKTKDGLELNPNGKEGYLGGTASIFVGTNYFYNYVNNNGSYYDFTEYIQNHTLDEIIYENQNEFSTEKDVLNDVMSLAPMFILYIMDNELSNGEFLKDIPSGYIICQRELGYVLPLNINGKYELDAYFDLEGNLLNINAAYEYFNYSSLPVTFEGSEELFDQQ